MAGIWPSGLAFDAQRAAAAALFLGGIALLLVIAIDALQQSAPEPVRVVFKIEELRPLGPDIRTIEIARGDTLTGILVEQGIGASEARAAVAALSSVYEPTSIRAGEDVVVTFAPEGSPLVSIALKPSAERDLLVRRNADGSFAVDDNVKVLTAVQSHARGTIDGSLYASAKAAGVKASASASIAANFMNILPVRRTPAAVRAGYSLPPTRL